MSESESQRLQIVSVSPDVMQLVSLDCVDWAINYCSQRRKGPIDIHFMNKQGIAVCFVLDKVTVVTTAQARILSDRIKLEMTSNCVHADGEACDNERKVEMERRQIARAVEEARAGIDLAATFHGHEESWATLEPHLATVFAGYVLSLSSDPRASGQAKYDALRKAGVPEAMLASDPPMTYYDWAVCLVGNVADVWRGGTKPQSAAEWTEALVAEYWRNWDAFFENPPTYDVI